jgi:hypothetical protein
MSQLDKRSIIMELDRIIVARLFGERPWLADRDACEALNRSLFSLGVRAPVPGEPGHSYITSLGAELDLELVMVFIGLWHEIEIPNILADYGFIDDDEASLLYERMGDDPERVLLPVVRRAFLRHTPARITS